MDDTKEANFLALLNFQQQAADRVLNQYRIRPDLTLEELAQVLMYLSDRLKEEKQQRQAVESQLQEMSQQVEKLESALEQIQQRLKLLR